MNTKEATGWGNMCRGWRKEMKHLISRGPNQREAQDQAAARREQRTNGKITSDERA